jgi:hypothetical protein
MRSKACAILLLSAGFCVLAQSPDSPGPDRTNDLQTAYCPNTHQLEVTPSQKLFLDGTIGRHHVRMYLDRGGTGVVGLFFDVGGNWEVTQLGGTWKSNRMDASNQTDDDPATGHLEASMSGNRLTGTWTAIKSNQHEPIDLVTIPEPKCDGRGDWKGFDDPAAPLTFSYPASWHLKQDNDGIWLTCPNPSDIAYSQDLGIMMGSGRFKGPTDLVQCGDQWIYNADCDCKHVDEASCRVAKASRKGPATILDVSDHEWRVYCHGGGYVGQGGGEDVIVLLPHSWVEIVANGDSSEIVDHLIQTVKEHPSKGVR